MSNMNWARGTIKIPAKDWPKVRGALVEHRNANQQRLLDTALEVHEALKGRKFKRGTNRGATLADEWRTEQAFGENCAPNRLMHRINDKERFQIARSIFPPEKDADGKSVWGTSVSRPQKPKKKDFPLANKATCLFEDDDLTIHLDAKTHTVFFEGEENNWSQERAMECPLAQVLFRVLSAVQWTARTGGSIVGNDEYSGEDCEEGGGANYVLRTFGKDAPRPRRQATSPRRASDFYGVCRGLGRPGFR
jgi:hypothetical protein